jgi:phosphomannomutase
MSLMISISGIRGIVGETLTPFVAVKYAAAFGKYCGRSAEEAPTVVVGRDGRFGGEALTNLVSSTLRSVGVNVVSLGICPTPTVQLATEHLKAAGGISVTASHNPVQWNGLKFLGPDGMFLNGEENRVLWKIAEESPGFVAWNHTGRYEDDDTWIRKHIDMVLGISHIDPATIRKRRFKVVVDCVNASGGKIVPTLLRELGCTVVELHCDLSGIFAHTPEPLPENLGELAALVQKEQADLGIAVDPDADRLVLITERGEPFGEEYTVTSAAKFILEAGKGRHTAPVVVVNLSTTRAVEDVAGAYDARLLRTPVGEINVAQKMKETGAVIGGEGSGGVILPALHFGRDAMAGIPLVLQLLASHGGTLSNLKESLPGYVIVKGKVALGNISPDAALETIRRSTAPPARINTDDGIRIDYPDYWVHLRKSNTEPIIRIIAEAKTKQQALTVVDDFRKRLSTI